MSRRKNTVAKNLKDYLVPIIWFILILFLLMSIFSSWEETTNIQTENRLGIWVSMDTSNTESFVTYPGQDKVAITENISLFKWEEILVKEWSLSLDIPELWNARLSKLWEIKYNENGSFNHTSWKVWFNTTWNVDINTRFATVKMWENSHVSFDQNEMASTVYALSGIVEVINLAGENTLLLPGEKISISRLDANNSELDMKSLKVEIDDLFKNDDWYVLNSWDRYLNMTEESEKENNEWEKLIIGHSRVLTFDIIEDEWNISVDSMNISGKYNDEEIVKITLNNSQAVLNTENKSFEFENVDLSSAQNDLVFRAFDDAGDILEKRLITLYYNGAQTTSSSNVFWEAKNYIDVDASQFTFTAPSKFTTYSTYFGEVTIQGTVLNKDVAFVKINGFQLGSFNTNYGTWKYHAFERFNTLSNGTNVYEVKYYDINNKLIYTNNYTIVKKSDQIIKTDSTISDEINIAS